MSGTALRSRGHQRWQRHICADNQAARPELAAGLVARWQIYLPTVPKEARVGYSLCLRLAARVWKGRSHLSATTPLVARQLADIVPDHSIRLVKQPLRSKSGRRATPRSLDTTSRQSSRRGNVRRLASRRHENLRLDQFRSDTHILDGTCRRRLPCQVGDPSGAVAANSRGRREQKRMGARL
jgi:hypothetical protein